MSSVLTQNEESDALRDDNGVKLTIPCHAIGANQVSGKHFRSYSAHKQQVTRDAQLMWIAAGRPTFERAIVRPRITFGAPARRDSANYHGAGTVKFIVDVLTKCGAWVDDGDKYVEQAPPVIRYVRGVWQVELVIEDAAQIAAAREDGAK